MIPAGYMYKQVVKRPDWIAAPSVEDIYSLSGCVSDDFADYINFWKHNGYWLFDSPAIIQEIARDNDIDVSSMTPFYYEVHDWQYDLALQSWVTFEPEPSFETKVVRPQDARLEGYDVVTFFCRTSPECSPLSCNHLAAELMVNRHCLFDSFEEAFEALEAGRFDNTEPGPFRIFAVYTVAT